MEIKNIEKEKPNCQIILTESEVERLIKDIQNFYNGGNCTWDNTAILADFHTELEKWKK